MTGESDPRSVLLRIPARADYVVLARLALSAVCRLTALPAHDVADLKLAVTEAAAGLMGAEGRDSKVDATDDRCLAFAYRLEDSQLDLEVEGTGDAPAIDEERDLRRAIIEAIADEWEHGERRTRLVKYLEGSAQ